MDARILDDRHHRLLYDPAQWPAISAADFDVERWLARGARATDAGRGSAWFLPLTDGREWVLRHYRRGGLVGKLLLDRYLWIGSERSRAWREFRLLQHLRSLALPVPIPVAARISRQGVRYRQDLVTVRIPASRPLSAELAERPLPSAAWAALGATLGRFHAAGVYHADLNADNVLFEAPDRFHLIDFDRGALGASAARQGASIRRLRRSLDKFARHQPGFHFAVADWQALIQGLSQRPR